MILHNACPASRVVTLVTLVMEIKRPMIRDRDPPMKRLNFLVSLTNNDNDYQQEQAAAAEKAARRLGRRCEDHSRG